MSLINKLFRRIILPSTGPVQVKHIIPGRVRFYIPLLKGDKNKADEIQRQLGTISSLNSVNVDYRSGSLLILFNEKEIGVGLLFATIIRLMGLDEELDREKTPKVIKEMKDVGDSLNKAVYDKTAGLLDLWTLIYIAFAFFGIKNLFSGRIPFFAASSTFLWWALNGLMRERIEQ